MTLLASILAVYTVGVLWILLYGLILLTEPKPKVLSPIDALVFAFLWPITVPYAVAMVVGEVMSE